MTVIIASVRLDAPPSLPSSQALQKPATMRGRVATAAVAAAAAQARTGGGRTGTNASQYTPRLRQNTVSGRSTISSGQRLASYAAATTSQVASRGYATALRPFAGLTHEGQAQRHSRTAATASASYSTRVPGSARPSRVPTRSSPAPSQPPRHRADHQHSSRGTEEVATSATSTLSGKGQGVAAPQQHASATSSPAPATPTPFPSPSSSSSSSRPTLDHATVLVPRDETGSSVIDSSESLRRSVETILGQPALVVTREIEMLNVFMGFEQANKYALVTPDGQQVGYLAEQETGMLGGTLRRQFLRTHRPFEAHILDTQGRAVMSIKRGLTWINSRSQVYVVDPEMAEERLVGEVQQVWHPWRRKYELFVNRQREGASSDDNGSEMVQFAYIDGALLTWDFVMTDESSRPLGAVSRNFRGIGRELFTDTGQYVLTFDPSSSPELRLEAPQQQQRQQQQSSSSSASSGIASSSRSGLELVESGPARALSMDERAVALALAVSADFDYFSRHSQHGHGGFFPFMWMGGGGSAPAEPANTPQPNTPQQQQGQDSSDVHAPPAAPGSDGGLGPAVGTGIGYEMMGGGRQARGGESSNAPGPSSDAGGPYGGAQPTQQGQAPGNDPYGDGGASNGPPSEWGYGADSNPSGSWGAAPPPPSGDLGTGEEDVWGGGDDDPWQDSTPSGGDGGGGWSLSDFFGGGD